LSESLGFALTAEDLHELPVLGGMFFALAHRQSEQPRLG